MATKHRVLFVDDEPHILKMFQRSLRNVFEVHTAENGAEALQVIKEKGAFPVVVSDLRMAHMGGIELLKHLKRDYPETVRVLLTGHADLQTALSAVNEGEVFRLLEKPCDVQVMNRVLLDATRQYELMRLEKELILSHRMLAEAYHGLEEMLDLKSRLITTASHDLKSPLTSIIGFIKLLRKDLGRLSVPETDGERVSRMHGNLEVVDQECQRLLRLITDLLDYSSMESGEVGWDDEELELKDAVDRAVEAVGGHLAEKPGLQINIKLGALLPPLTINPDRLQQLLVNVLDNALKFTDLGEVRLTASMVGRGFMQIRVSDTGAGIEPERLDKVFDLYHTTPAKADGPKGTGLGLAICRQIVEHYRGSIWAESVLGSGTTMVINLPAGQD